jgi:hypothetical protein
MDKSPHRGVIACRHVLREGAPIRRISATDDGDLQILCIGGQHQTAGEAAWVHLHHLLDRDPSIREALDVLELGLFAYRTATDQPWVIEHLPPEEHAA